MIDMRDGCYLCLEVVGRESAITIGDSEGGTKRDSGAEQLILHRPKGRSIFGWSLFVMASALPGVVNPMITLIGWLFLGRDLDFYSVGLAVSGTLARFPSGN